MIIIHNSGDFFSCALNPERISLLKVNVCGYRYNPSPSHVILDEIKNGKYMHKIGFDIQIVIQNLNEPVITSSVILPLSLEYSAPIKTFLENKLIMINDLDNPSFLKDIEKNNTYINMFTQEELDILTKVIFRKLYTAFFETPDGNEVLIHSIVENAFKKFVTDLFYNQQPETK